MGNFMESFFDVNCLAQKHTFNIDVNPLEFLIVH
jgi:hypothetical protein